MGDEGERFTRRDESAGQHFRDLIDHHQRGGGQQTKGSFLRMIAPSSYVAAPPKASPGGRLSGAAYQGVRTCHPEHREGS